jgi:2-isopropylmalate synthase
MPIERYRAFAPVDLPDRTWPSAVISEAPRWLSTDLRDGNQALIDPMTPARKLRMFDLLVSMGYKEIEIGFPSASQTDFDFVRQLVEGDRIPEDVTISVLTQAREDLIERTVQSLVGVHHANIHLYNALAPLFRRVVFHAGKDEIKDIAVRGTQLVMKHSESYLGQTVIGYEYSPEIFTGTELPFSVEVCEAVSDVWQPEDGREIILNLPATIEMATPNQPAPMNGDKNERTRKPAKPPTM